MEEEPVKKVEFLEVNKFKEDWSANSLFSGFNVRAILTHQQDFVTKIVEADNMRRKLTKKIGPEGKHWFMEDDLVNNNVEVYLQDSGCLVMWKLNDNQKFNLLFDRIEQHIEDI